MLVLSHDEVVHEKKSLLSKMPGPDWQKFANVRLLYSHMICHPGKNLIFMGAEIGQWSEWDCKINLSWELLQYAFHIGLFEMVRDLNLFYLANPAFWERDFDWGGFEWIDFSNAEHSVISYLRKGNQKILACIHNFTPEYYPQYWIRQGNIKKIREVFNTDAGKYGGSNKLNPEISLEVDGFYIALSPLATLIFEIEF
jgi:1,4-alpha-glucan branching enzyme